MSLATSDLIGQWPGLATPPAGLRTRVASSVTRSLFHRVAARYGIRVVMPGQPVPTDGGPTIVLNRPDEFYARTGRDLLIGFGESFMTGAWDSPDLAELLTALAADIGSLVPERLQRWRRWYVARHPHAHRNSVDNSRNNISHHYDLSNDLFAAFLDETMTYSSAIFPSDPPAAVTRGDLAEAQRRKIDRLLDVARVGEGTRVLEIGTGWGELALRAAARGATVTSVTLSEEQLVLARERIAAAGLGDRVSVELCDYREAQGSYDAVVSVEMIEAVGHEYLPSYFQTIHDRLVPGGRAGIQAIVMPHDRMLATLGTHTWVHKYIFPGGFLPSTMLLDEVSRAAGLRTMGTRALGLHYAETLRLWDETFMGLDVAALGFDEVFRRMWHFYLCYSRAGFASGYLDVVQLDYLRPR